MNKKIITTVVSILAVSALSSVSAGSVSYDFKDPKGVNNVAFEMDAPLEYISGTGSGISGTVNFDPAHPEKTSGTIVLESGSLMVANEMMRDHMLSAGWIDAEQYPTITFKTDKLTDFSEKGNKIHATAHGSLTLKGVTQEIEVPVTLTYLPGKLSARNRGMEGDILVVRSSFSILRSDYGIKAGEAEDKVSDEIQLKLSIAGFYAK